MTLGVDVSAPLPGLPPQGTKVSTWADERHESIPSEPRDRFSESFGRMHDLVIDSVELGQDSLVIGNQIYGYRASR